MQAESPCSLWCSPVHWPAAFEVWHWAATSSRLLSLQPQSCVLDSSWQLLNPSWPTKPSAVLGSFPRWVQILLLPLARKNNTIKKNTVSAALKITWDTILGIEHVPPTLFAGIPLFLGLCSNLLGKSLQDLQPEWATRSSSTRFSCIAELLWYYTLYITWATPAVCVSVKN